MKIKHTLFLAIAFLSITSVFAQKSTIEKDLKMYTQVWDDIVNKGQIDLINDKNFDTNITQINASGNIVGIADFKAYYQNFITGFSEIKFTVIDAFGQGDKIAKHWRFEGKHTGDFFGIPATGNSVNMEGVTLAKMKNGKIIQEQDFLDNSVMMQQLGLASNPDNVSIIDGMYSAFANGDIPSVLGAMDAKIEWNEAEGNSLADGNPYVGPDAVLNGVFVRLGANHEYFKLADIQLHDMSKNHVLATLRYDAKNKSTGKVYNAQVAHLWTLIDGKVVAFQQYVDTKKLADAEKN
ncbi:MAG: ester cyclase [Aquaticitalea sp.]